MQHLLLYIIWRQRAKRAEKRSLKLLAYPYILYYYKNAMLCIIIVTVQINDWREKNRAELRQSKVYKQLDLAAN